MTPEEVRRLADEVLELDNKASVADWGKNPYWFNVEPDEIPPCHIMIDGRIVEMFRDADADLIVRYRTAAPLLARAWEEERNARLKLAAEIWELKNQRGEWDVEHSDSPHGYIVLTARVEAVPGLDREALEDAFGTVVASVCDCGKDEPCSIEHYQSSTGVKCLFHEDRGNESHGGEA